MSDEEDTAILLNNATRNIEPSVSKPVTEDYQCIPAKNLRKPIPKQTDNLTPLTSTNQNILVSIVAIVAGVAFGYDMGIAKPTAPLIKDEFMLSCFEEDTVINIWFVGALLGGLTGGILIDTFGRRWAMILMLVFLTFGSLLSALASHYILLLIARVICGYSGTVSSIAHCIYMAEVSDTNKRGHNIMLYQFGTATGLLLAVILEANKTADCQWRFAMGVTSVPALASCIITIIFLQRSPAFLLLKRTVHVSKATSKHPWGNVLETLLIMAIVLILQQETGRQQVLYYAPRLFALLGICANVAQITAVIALGIVRVFSTILSLVVVERCGRRTALITSATICMTAISLLSLLATLDRGDETLSQINTQCMNSIKANYASNGIRMPGDSVVPTGSPPPFPLLPTPLAVAAPSPETWTQVKASCETQNVITSEGLTGGLRILAVITLLVYEAAFALGLGPVPFLTLSEVFPATVRGKCVSFSVVILWISYIVAMESVTKITKSMTLAGSYLFYSFVCLIAIFYVFLLIPETKGKSLHQVAQELRKISLGTRVCNNLRSLPLVCHLEWIKRFGERSSNSQSTLI
ncbi:solute carrier family 2, facilitated glucose transporter member 10 [Orussus abietinus]|uniref:solute carrier family 2, facilitated glucose transporter member 10 n=1 Tax=Orussus abietinus TaxID=222816 RepID=UPI000625285B|nr:solute carrier family 2, facilitated glucose transporter member 10 [Orussus abietinus]XP_012274799.1 solute carrier family 2, facilitated glucose transporter member 10 [Orussus abietinus]XP_012274800.1 solute carrier family 2, facilitated glucose transporter member 10 [Orussus abietinus]